MWIETVLKILEVSLSLWESKERTKYQDKYLRLKKEWYEEFNKDDSERSDAALDNIQFEMKILIDSFVYSAGNKK